jgi:REP element-mobilizing transposase RayT
MPAIYHCVNRVVDRRFVFGPREKDKFVEIMRMYEAFAGIRILAHCVMSNHFHLMLEITPMPDGGLSDEELLNRLAAIYDETTVEAIELELLNARKAVAGGRATLQRIEEIHHRYTYRMHDLSEFMKSLVQRFTQWHNRRNERKGNLWEDAFRSTVVEPGIAARMVATYIDLNPVRAGIVGDPSNYPWCSHGEATGQAKQNKKPNAACLRARSGLVRAFFAHQGIEPDARRWNECQKIQRPWIEQAMEKVRASRAGKPSLPNEADTPGSTLAGRIRHFTEGVAIGGRDFLDTFFEEKRDRFGSKRNTGARPIRGRAAGMARQEGICSIRDLQKHLDP